MASAISWTARVRGDGPRVAAIATRGATTTNRSSRCRRRVDPVPHPAVAKRSEKKRQARKIGRREDLREAEAAAAARATRAAEEAAKRAAPPPPPLDSADASARVAARETALRDALRAVGDAKATARESETWDPSRGYKPFDAVRDAVDAMARARVAALEARLERAVALLCVAKREPVESLAKFGWTYGERTIADTKNARCLGFMLAAMSKANVSTGTCEVLSVAMELDLIGEVDAKAVKGAVRALREMDELGLLDEGEPEVLAAAAEATEAAAAASDAS